MRHLQGKLAEPVTLLVCVYVSQSVCMFMTESGTNRGAKAGVNTGTDSEQVNDCPEWLRSQPSGETHVHTFSKS